MALIDNILNGPSQRTIAKFFAPTRSDKIAKALRSSRGWRKYYMDQSISGYWRLFKRLQDRRRPSIDDLIIDDPAYEDFNDKNLASYSFANYLIDEVGL
jgi:hypothetical protein